MNKLILALAFSICAFSAQASCDQHFPYGDPKVSGHVQLLCKTGYGNYYNIDAKIPSITSYVLTPEHTIGCVPRSNKFASDPEVKNGPKPSDYTNSGYDKGHNVNDADQGYTVTTDLESFYMTNMSPQLPNFNRGIWKKLETLVRDWSYVNNNTLVIYAGNIWSSNSKNINGVIVPDAMYKIIIDKDHNSAIAFLFPHQNNLKDLNDYIVSISSIEEKTGIVFPVPSNINKNDVGHIIDMPSDKQRQNQKTNVCK